MKPVLFVCVENSCRSQMSEAFAKMHSKDSLETHSAGSRASGKVNEKEIRSVQEVGYDLNTHQSESLNEIPDVEYEYAITMGYGDECPYVNAKQRQDWASPDPKAMDDQDFNQVRNMIRNQDLVISR